MAMLVKVNSRKWHHEENLVFRNVSRRLKDGTEVRV